VELKAINQTLKVNAKISVIFTLPEKLYLVDFLTRYIGYYENNGLTAVITSYTSHGGIPYLTIAGFDKRMINQKVIVQVDRDGLGFREKEFEVNLLSAWSGDPYYNLDGTYMGYNPIGFLVLGNHFPKGIYNFTFKYKGMISKMKLIKNF
ncbi:hypothetical protein LDI23_001653, partial [Campylobacter lari]|nr:hypothetical protein [Campylobacter lari]EIE4560819.1 hypothetical protein [Campylobacter lari]